MLGTRDELKILITVEPSADTNGIGRILSCSGTRPFPQQTLRVWYSFSHVDLVTRLLDPEVLEREKRYFALSLIRP